jgi:hypothetical protein
MANIKAVAMPKVSQSILRKSGGTAPGTVGTGFGAGAGAGAG